ncbi:MAG: hypothetical protein V1906_03105 [Candidatus Woesearchaeota archaeon]
MGSKRPNEQQSNQTQQKTNYAQKPAAQQKPVAQQKPNPQKSYGQDRMVEALIEHNINLQHKLADLIISVRELNGSVKNMVDLFTEAGEHIKKGKYEDPLFVKLDDLLEQNKNLAKGLLLLEKFIREKQAAPIAFPQRMQRPEY